jgi:hypothetical protein
MKNSAKRVWQWVKTFRTYSLVPTSTSRRKKSRPRWFGRLLSIGIDTAVCSIFLYTILYPLGLANSSLASLAILALLPVYYMAFEGLLGRTPGKIFMGYKMSLPDPANGRGLLFWRGMLRFIPGLNIPLILSWRRVTLLDLISGTRVRLSIPPDEVSHGASGESSQPSRSSKPRVRGFPRGYDPSKLER